MTTTEVVLTVLAAWVVGSFPLAVLVGRVPAQADRNTRQN